MQRGHARAGMSRARPQPMKDREDYKVIAREWRPRKFEDVVGQPHIVTTLKNSIRRDRIAHAYLFAGPRGVGKTTVARILAKAVNCAQGVSEEPCDECETCKAINGSGFVDVIEIDAASNRGIDEIRELRETVRYLPMAGRRKVYIIDEAHMLTDPAFNALLKTLEEPPGHNIFILATTESHKIPYTIVSQVPALRFQEDIGVGDHGAVAPHLPVEGDRVRREGAPLHRPRGGRGAARRGVDTRPGHLVQRAHIAEKDVIDVIGVVRRDVAYAIVKSIVEKDPKEGPRPHRPHPRRGQRRLPGLQGAPCFPPRHAHDKAVAGQALLRLHGRRGAQEGGRAFEDGRVLRDTEHGAPHAQGGRPHPGRLSTGVPGGPLREPLQPVAASGRGGDDRCGRAQRGPHPGSLCRAEGSRPPEAPHHEPPAAGRRAVYAAARPDCPLPMALAGARPPMPASTEPPDPAQQAGPPETPAAAGPPGDFVSYLKDKSKMLFGMLALSRHEGSR